MKAKKIFDVDLNTIKYYKYKCDLRSFSVKAF